MNIHEGNSSEIVIIKEVKKILKLERSGFL